MHWSFGRESLPGPPSPVLISLIPRSVASRPIVLNFDQSQTYLRSAVWNPLGAAVFAEADCSIGSSTALCLAAAACDRAGSLDSNSIIISPFKSSAFFRDYAQQWNLTSSMGGDSLRVCSLSLTLLCLSFSPSPSLTFCHLCEVYDPLPFPSTQGFGQEPATSPRQIFSGSPKAILPGFPLGLYPLPMFQIIYRRIYLLYVVMDSFDMARSKETQHLTCTFPQFNLLLYSQCLVYFYLLQQRLSCVCLEIVPSLCFPSQHNIALCRGGGALCQCCRKNKYDATLLSFKSDK